MTPAEAIKKLDALSGQDPEVDHQEADTIVWHVLRANGLAAVADAYERARARGGYGYA